MQPDTMEEEIRVLSKRARRARLWSPEGSTVTLDYGPEAVKRLLPHRDPFLFVDRITAFDPAQQTMAAWRCIVPDDPVFVGHFPGDPIYPGVLQLETMGQVAICLSWMLTHGSAIGPDARPLEVRALKIHTATFLAPVLPGAELTVLARMLVDDGQAAVCAGQLLAGDTVTALAVMEMLHVDPT